MIEINGPGNFLIRDGKATFTRNKNHNTTPIHGFLLDMEQYKHIALQSKLLYGYLLNIQIANEERYYNNAMYDDQANLKDCKTYDDHRKVFFVRENTTDLKDLLCCNEIELEVYKVELESVNLLEQQRHPMNPHDLTTEPTNLYIKMPLIP